MWQKIKNIYHLSVAIVANLIYGFPSKELVIIGITGTDGKTTTASLIYHILSENGFNASVVTSIGALIGGRQYDTGFHVTTPSSIALQRFLRKAANTSPGPDGKKYMVLEVTSHAIDQNRIAGIHFDVVVLTNITHEHLDYHKTYKAYLNTKARLLKAAQKAAVVNHDDASYTSLVQYKNTKWITYGLKNNSDINVVNFPIKTALVGEFNIYNTLAASATCKALGLRQADVRKAISTFTLPVGRGEIVYDKTFTVMIDFAHTPNAIKQLLSSIKAMTKGRIIHVFGSAGERDYGKRPEMGRVSSLYADVIILTAEDSRSEPVIKIIEEIASGISSKKKKQVLKIPNRRDSIRKAISLAKKGDYIVITGKGHERSINLGQGEEQWSEHEVVKKALSEYGKD